MISFMFSKHLLSSEDCDCYDCCRKCVLCTFAGHGFYGSTLRWEKGTCDYFWSTIPEEQRKTLQKEVFSLQQFNLDAAQKISGEFEYFRENAPQWCLSGKALCLLKKEIHDLYFAETSWDLFLHNNWEEPKFFKWDGSLFGSSIRVKYLDVMRHFTLIKNGGYGEIKFYREYLNKINLLRSSFTSYINCEINIRKKDLKKWDRLLERPWSNECREYGGATTVRKVHKPMDEKALKKEEDNLKQAALTLNQLEIDIFKIFSELHQHCVAKHYSIETAYDHGLLEYQLGNYNNCIDSIETLLIHSTKEDLKELNHEILITLGSSYIESSQYHEAIEVLSKVLEEDPANKEAHFNRALANFELGEWEDSSSDFLASDLHTYKGKATDTVNFALGFTKGVSDGIANGAIEFLPGILSSLQGLSHCIWAIGSDPQLMLGSFVEGIYDTLSFIQSNPVGASLLEGAMIVAPELREIVLNWNTMEDRIKGEKIGHLIGKYGLEILLTAGSVKGVQALQRLKRANGILTLEALTSTAAQESALVAASEAWNSRHLTAMEKFKVGEYSLKEYKGQNLTETQARSILHQAGFKTFKRPEGIPSNFRIQLSNRGGGMIYYHPEHNHTSIRIMSGKPHSPNPLQQKPYVIYKIDGKCLDKYGNFVATEATEAHIPLDEFVIREL